MSIGMDVKLPSEDELTVPQEITLSMPYLKAVAPYMHMKCENEVKEFMLRRRELEDPRATLKEGATLTSCGVKFLQSLKKNCAGETDALARKIDNPIKNKKNYLATPFSSGAGKEQKDLDECVENNLGVKRPAMGYFMYPKAHESSQPAPTPKIRDYKAEAAKVLSSLPEETHLRSDYRQYREWRHLTAQES